MRKKVNGKRQERGRERRGRVGGEETNGNGRNGDERLVVLNFPDRHFAEDGRPRVEEVVWSLCDTCAIVKGGQSSVPLPEDGAKEVGTERTKNAPFG